MTRSLLAAAALAVLPSTALAADGAALFASKACTACHHADKDQSAMGLGPSVAQIKTAYAADGKGGADAIAKFLNGEGTAIVKPDLFPIMQGQIAITKTMTAEERKAIADFIMK